METKEHVYTRQASYQAYQIDLDKLYYHKIIRAVHQFSDDPKGRLLDVGCWDGMLASQFLPNREVYGLEGNLEAGLRANQRGVKTQSVDLEKGLFPFPDDFFDTVIAAEIIEHVYDTDLFLKELKRVLRPGGTLVMSIPNMASLSNRIRMLFGAYPRNAEYRAGGAGHIRFYTAPVFKAQVQEAGFEVLQFAGCNLPMPMHNRLIPRWLKKIAAAGGDSFPNLAGQVILAGRKNKSV
ncbi:MAG: class I SAM-dependent methyltransferase [Candidatus Omnitrophica bacterium]|jgi:methionine biosynthesis protein MetW|nr:class I SAM-dependent methyltransferase [Candidatus Omnitrophota bacterium]